MSAVVISGDTSGSVTLQAPAVSGNTTLNLPAVNGTVALTSELGSIILLGTVTAGSGNSVSLTGLNLTTYKRLWITLSNIRSAVQSYMYISSNNINTNSHYIALAAGGVTGSSNLLIDLTDGTVVGGSAMFASLYEKTNMSTSSTAIYFRLESTHTYNNASASIKVYGEK